MVKKMSKTTKIKSVEFNFIMNFILTASNFIFPLITFPYVSRVLLASGNGKIAFIASVASYFSMVASLGIPTYGIRACAVVRDDKDKLSKLVHELIIIHSIMTMIAIALFFLSYLFVGKLQQEKELMLINGISLLLNVLGVNWLYSALEQYQYITIRSLIFKVISVFLMFALVHEEKDYILYGAISVFASAGSNVLNFINMRKHVSLRRYKNYNLMQHVRPILVFFAQTVAITVYTNLDTLMLGFIKNDSEVGLYTAAIKVKNILSTLVTSLGTVLLPRLSYYTANGYKQEFEKLIHRAVEFVLVLSVSITVYFVIMAKECILLFSGTGYLGATLAMQIIIPTVIFIGLSNITGIQILTPLNKERYVLVSVIVGALVDFVLNALLIPKMGAAGAAIGTLVAEGAVLCVQLYFIRKLFHMHIFNKKQFAMIVGLTGVSGIVLWIVNAAVSMPTLIQLIITCMVYFVLVLALAVLLKVEIVRDIIGKVVKKYEV